MSPVRSTPCFQIHFPFFCAASASATRAPRRMVEIIVLPSWQAHSYTGPFVFVHGISAVQGLAHVVGSSTVNSELLTYPYRNLSGCYDLEKSATANRMRRSVPGKVVSALLRVSHRAATACDRWAELNGDRVMRSSSFVGSSAAVDCRAV